MQSRELYTHQIAVKRQELTEIPKGEQEELALIYQAQGVDPQTAGNEARHIMGGGESGDGGSATTLETPIRKELSTDPKELGEHNVIYS